MIGTTSINTVLVKAQFLTSILIVGCGAKSDLGSQLDEGSPASSGPSSCSNGLPRCDGGTNTSIDEVTLFSFDIVDADYSRSLDRVVIASYSPPALHIVNPFTRRDETVLPLESEPVAVSVSPDGRYAVVAIDRAVVYADLTSRTLVKTITLLDSPVVKDVALGGNGSFYSVVGGQEFHVTDIATTIDVMESGLPGWANVELGANGQIIWFSGESIDAYDVSVTPPVYASDFTASVVNVSGPLWVDRDGKRLFIGSGPVFDILPAAANKHFPTKLEYTLDGLPRLYNGGAIVHVDASASHVALLADDGHTANRTFPYRAGGGLLNIYDPTTLALVSQRTLPSMPIGDGGLGKGLGCFVFHSADESRLFVLLQAYTGPQLTMVFGMTEM